MDTETDKLPPTPTDIRRYLCARSNKRRYGYAIVDGLRIRLRSLFMDERTEVNRRWRDERGEDTQPDAYSLRQAALMAMSIIDDAGNLVFDDKPGDLQVLKLLDGPVLDAIDKTMRMLNFAPAEQLEKNCGLETNPVS